MMTLSMFPNGHPLLLVCYHRAAKSLLWHQVRRMASILFDVGQKLEYPSVVEPMCHGVHKGSWLLSNGRPKYRLASLTSLLFYKCRYLATVLRFFRVKTVIISFVHLNALILTTVYASSYRPDAHPVSSEITITHQKKGTPSKLQNVWPKSTPKAETRYYRHVTTRLCRGMLILSTRLRSGYR